jgi:hypothetical protein
MGGVIETDRKKAYRAQPILVLDEFSPVGHEPPIADPTIVRFAYR